VFGHPWAPTRDALREVTEEHVDVRPLWVPGCGPDHDQELRVRVHARIAHLVESVFARIARINGGRYYFWSIGSHYPRYKKNRRLKARDRDDQPRGTS